MQDLSNLIIGNDFKVTLPDGRQLPYVYFDNGASTPALKSVQRKLEQFIPYYSSIHRGSGFKSRLSTHIFEEARDIMRKFVGAPDSAIVAFTRNATESINMLAHYARVLPGNQVIISEAEHHANDLPWRDIAEVVRIPVDNCGVLDLGFLERKLAQGAGDVKIVSLTGASNISGTVSPYREVAELVHRYDTLIHLDAAQLAPHKPIDMTSAGIDFVSLSGHKMYAPYGSGILVGPYDFFTTCSPLLEGGGCVEVVTTDTVMWAPPPERLEAGTPNVPGAVAIAQAARSLQAIGFPILEENEEELTQYLLQELEQIPDVRIIGHNAGWEPASRLGVISLIVGDLPHELVGAVLEFEHGIATRGGCFCAHPYIIKVMEVDDKTVAEFTRRMLDGDHTHRPGLVRFSLGLYNTLEEAKRAVAAIRQISRREFVLDYELHRDSGEYLPRGFDYNLKQYFSFD
ncbi:MAG: aminotransferase class V-fold PLP-dependent enzyme [Candidatus Delongbacteria bacterium]|nr:aminotransferase class V-fold PLP-dependent enzyme [Candidatus Delongbacteria bacterium]